MHPRSLPTGPGRVLPGAIGHNRGVVSRNYAFLPPEGVLPSRLPNYEATAVRFLAAPALGAAFAQALLEIAPGGGSRQPCADTVQTFLYAVGGSAALTVDGHPRVEFTPGGYAYVPPGCAFSLRNDADTTAKVLVLRKPYEAIDLPPPEAIVSHRSQVPRTNHLGMEGRAWQHLLPVGDMRFDMEMNILIFSPGVCFPAVETHIMEHGLYMLEGQGIYLLDTDWHEIWVEDFIWMGPFCPQQFYPTGYGEAAYLLYKNVNREIAF